MKDHSPVPELPPPSNLDLPEDAHDSAHRLISVQPDPQLLAQGWERRFFASGARLKEMVELYRSLGYEVHIEPVRRPDLPDSCDDCQLAALLEFQTIYTRRPPVAP